MLDMTIALVSNSRETQGKMRVPQANIPAQRTLHFDRSACAKRLEPQWDIIRVLLQATFEWLPRVFHRVDPLEALCVRKCLTLRWPALTCL